MSDMDATRTFSVFGDSLSTLQGFQPEGYAVQYKGRFRERSGVLAMDDTWWGMVISRFGGRLLTNDAYSGCTVAGLRTLEKLFPAACSRRRIDALATAGEPDVLMIYLGTNDWDAQVAPFPGPDDLPWWRCFEGAYAHMLADIRARFARSEIWCLNLTCSKAMLRDFPRDYLDTMPIYNDIIAEQASRAGATLVDLYGGAMGYSSADLGHADRAGMRRIADVVISTVSRQDARKPQIPRLYPAVE